MPATPPPDLARLFAEAAPRFGLSRPAGACFAAIWRAAQAPSAEDLVTILGLSRSNVSVALKELRERGLIQAARSFGSRKDYFVADPDPWALLRALLIERQRRDLAPLAERLAALAEGSDDPRLAPLAQMVQSADDWFARLARHDAAELAQLMQAGELPKKKKKKNRD
ncbi:GbsR/MarR family transcriptional regulator [Sinirhodobacter huangdaonensis]|jgi:DNA-binding transcriptional regulator GbsR (MarR family)|uniref:HTH marR-type domain-containing protein n=1 Tax=Paenirhodobacter huangdaonensis TaxID=2501515 RepID=A0A3S3NC14_9RHOB|nr:MarR family transcriptional regulator [Sinirhodobacter huangdaonensis]RWR53987.1 hypothetical protein EOW66_05065 [Sinirhodobacter huangdaonensis]